MLSPGRAPTPPALSLASSHLPTLRPCKGLTESPLPCSSPVSAPRAGHKQESCRRRCSARDGHLLVPCRALGSGRRDRGAGEEGKKEKRNTWFGVVQVPAARGERSKPRRKAKAKGREQASPGRGTPQPAALGASLPSPAAPSPALPCAARHGAGEPLPLQPLQCCARPAACPAGAACTEPLPSFPARQEKQAGDGC